MRHAGIMSSGGELAQESYLRFRKPLMSFFLRRVRSRADAEDLTHEVLLRVLHAGDEHPVHNPEAFIFTIAINLLRDRRRQELRRGTSDNVSFEEVENDGFGLSPSPMEAFSPERVLLGNEALAQVLGALGELDERTRNVFLLFRLEGMRQKDIALRYKIGTSTVEKLVMKAVLHLARRCGTEDRDPGA